MTPHIPPSSAHRAGSRCAPGRLARDPARRRRRSRSRTGPCRFDAVRQSVQHHPRGRPVADGQARDDAQLLGSIPSATWFTQGHARRGRGGRTPLRRPRQRGRGDARPRRVQPAVPRLRAVLGRRGDQHRRVRGVDRRPRRRHRRPRGDGDPRAGRARDHPALHDHQRRHRVVPAGRGRSRRRPQPTASTQLNYAVDALGGLAAASVYLDGTHSGWLGVGDISDRLIKAGVERAEGFFLNASNYVETERLAKYGTWISDCINLSQNSWWEPAWCASQYYPADPADFSTWGLSDAAYDQAYADTGVTRDPAARRTSCSTRAATGRGPGRVRMPRTPVLPPARPRGLVQPARTRPRRPPDDQHGRRPHRRLPVDQGARASRTASATAAPAARSTPSAAWRTPRRASGSPSRRASSSSSPTRRSTALDCHVSWDAAGAGKAFSAKLGDVDGATGLPLTFVWSGDQQAVKATHATVSQTGHVVTVTRERRVQARATPRTSCSARTARPSSPGSSGSTAPPARPTDPLARRGPVRRLPPRSRLSRGRWCRRGPLVSGGPRGGAVQRGPLVCSAARGALVSAEARSRARRSGDRPRHP